MGRLLIAERGRSLGPGCRQVLAHTPWPAYDTHVRRGGSLASGQASRWPGSVFWPSQQLLA